MARRLKWWTILVVLWSIAGLASLACGNLNETSETSKTIADPDRITEWVAAICGILNAVAVVLGLLGWKHHAKVKAAAQEVEQVGAAVILGVEAYRQSTGRAESRAVADAIQAVAEERGVEPALHAKIVDLGL